MNERIKELIAQAEISRLEYDPATMMTERVQEFDKEKFAELIIKECTTTILKESKWYWDKDEFESSNAVQNAARRVKEHFGVEE